MTMLPMEVCKFSKITISGVEVAVVHSKLRRALFALFIKPAAQPFI